MLTCDGRDGDAPDVFVEAAHNEIHLLNGPAGRLALLGPSLNERGQGQRRGYGSASRGVCMGLRGEWPRNRTYTAQCLRVRGYLALVRFAPSGLTGYLSVVFLVLFL